MINVGIIGTGKHGSRYAYHIVADCDGLHLAGISRRSAEGHRQAADWGAVCFNDWRKLVESPDVEAVICVVPPALNRDIARLCSKYRKPLLVEKPLAISSQEGAEIIACMKETGTPLTVGQTLRYNPVIRTLKTELESCGRLYTIYANQRLEPVDLPWLEIPEQAGAGVSFQTAVHVFDALHYITGRKITRVSAMCRTCKMQCLEDLLLCYFEMEHGGAGVVDVSKLSAARSGRYEFVCEDSHLYGDQIHGYVGRIQKSGDSIIAQCYPEPTIVSLLHDWERFLHDKGENPIPAEHGLYAIRVSDACLVSSSRNCWVDV